MFLARQQLVSIDEIAPRIAVRHSFAKRFFDLMFSSLALLCGSPFFGAIALCIKCTSKGPIFYRQERIGRGGRIFFCYKFRSMYSDADKRLKQLLESDPKLKLEWLASCKLKSDPRVTPFGLWLRKTSLDELPQFWNVWKGDLSVVGPRPVVRREVEQYFGARAIRILSVRPGLTCFWQVSGRSNMSYEERLRLDEEYVEKQNLLLDLKLIAQTIPAMFFPKGAY